MPRERRLGSGSIVLIAGLGVMLAIGLVTGLVAARRANAPQPAALSGTGAPVVVPAPVAQVAHAVRYELSGGHALNITYVARDSEIEQVADATAPWSVSVDDQSPVGSTAFYSLSAQNAGDGALSCRIVVDGTVASEASVTGQQAVVRCSKSMN
ncbi:MAG TPA: MmpS family transport accessory protein [Amycolatopsis sp.]|nr:MmpS family transport accessory protein [Amycolatopsis sp.]